MSSAVVSIVWIANSVRTYATFGAIAVACKSIVARTREVSWRVRALSVTVAIVNATGTLVQILQHQQLNQIK
jgi:hypothetical protein